MCSILMRNTEKTSLKKQFFFDQPFMWGEEKGLLLKEIDEKEFSEFLEKFRLFLKKVVDQLAASNSLEA